MRRGGRRRRLILVGALLALAARPAVADPAAVTHTPEEAAVAAAFPIVSLPVFRARVGYRDIRSGGNATELNLQAIAPMPDVLVPGLRIRGFYSLVRIDVPILSVNTPDAHGAGLGDAQLFDVAVKPLGNLGIALGFGSIIPTASRPALGLGTLQVGPVAAVAYLLKNNVLGVALLLENLFSVAGDGPKIDVLLAQPVIELNLPKANFLLFEPIWVFDWNRSGHATIPVSLSFGHAFSGNLVIALEAVWVTTGDGQNDVTGRAELSYIGW